MGNPMEKHEEFLSESLRKIKRNIKGLKVNFELGL